MKLFHNPYLLKDEILYIFPPKVITGKVACHLARYYSNHKILMVFHAFMELPLGIENLINLGATLTPWADGHISIVPCENLLEFNNQKFTGKWNTTHKTTYILRLNI